MRELEKPINDVFLKLVQLGIGTGVVSGSSIQVLSSSDWQTIKELADNQGLTAVVLDGLENVQKFNGSSVQHTLPLAMKLEWIGEVLQNYEQRYQQYANAISSLAGWYNAHGYKMMVLKGYACCLDWPKPEHRPCGDIDIWQFGKQKEADALLFNEKGVDIDNSHHHHTVFTWGDFAVENHYDFINVHHHKSHVALEKILKNLGADDSHSVEVSGERIYLPSANLHALFLLKHAALHFVGTELTFRQVLDWAFFVEKHGNDVDWKWLVGVLEEYGMKPFFNILNAICVEDLGFDQSLFPTISFNPLLKERVLEDILSYQYQEDNQSVFIRRQVNRFRRWKSNEWKHELCYKESMWSAFWSGVCGHLLKPSTL